MKIYGYNHIACKGFAEPSLYNPKFFDKLQFVGQDIYK